MAKVNKQVVRKSVKAKPPGKKRPLPAAAATVCLPVPPPLGSWVAVAVDGTVGWENKS